MAMRQGCLAPNTPATPVLVNITLPSRTTAPAASSTTNRPVLSDRSRPIVSSQLLPSVIAGSLLAPRVRLIGRLYVSPLGNRPSHSISPWRGRGGETPAERASDEALRDARAARCRG